MSSNTKPDHPNLTVTPDTIQVDEAVELVIDPPPPPNDPPHPPPVNLYKQVDGEWKRVCAVKCRWSPHNYQRGHELRWEWSPALLAFPHNGYSPYGTFKIAFELECGSFTDTFEVVEGE